METGEVEEGNNKVEKRTDVCHAGETLKQVQRKIVEKRECKKMYDHRQHCC